MEDLCIICEHPAREHWGSGCHKTSFLRGSCDCTFVEQPHLPASASAEQYRKRAAWWNERIRITDHHISRARYGSDRQRRLELFRENAADAAQRATEMAELTETREARERAAREAAEAAAAREAERAKAEAARQELLDGIGIEDIQSQPLCTLGMYEELFDNASAAEQAAVHDRVEAEYDALAPAEQRELLEDIALRDFLEHIGVVHRATIGVMQPLQPSRGSGPSPSTRPEVGSAEWADEMVDIASDPSFGQILDEAMRRTDAHARFVRQLDEEYGDTAGDAYWAQTEAEEGRLPRDESFIDDYEQDRSRIEAYWQNWALAPSPMLQQALMRSDPDGFKRHMTMAILLLTPPEKLCFKSHDELFGWIASGMKPLIVDGERVPLSEIVEPRYLAAA